MSNYALVELSEIRLEDKTTALVANFNDNASAAQGEHQIIFGRNETLDNITKRLLGQDWSQVATQLKSNQKDQTFYIRHPDQTGYRAVPINNGRKSQRTPVAA